MNIKLPFGLQDGQLTDISSVESGLACDCFCPGCGKQLIAKKGNVKEHHFAHYDNIECKGAIETSLHIQAKHILEKNNRIVLPPVYFANRLIYPPTEVFYDNILLEKRIDNIIPDVIIHIKGRPLLIEISVTHFLDRWKKLKIAKLGYSAIEIDVKALFNPIHYKVFGYQDFEKRLIEETDRKHWVNNSKQNFIRKKAAELAISKKVIRLEAMYDEFPIVDCCPLNKRFYKRGYKQGQSYASVYNDCYSCPYTESEVDFRTSEVNCSGHRQKEIDDIIIQFLSKQHDYQSGNK